MDMSLLCRRLGISNPRVGAKGAELMRLANARIAGGGLGAGEACKAVVCLELAAMLFQEPIDRSAAQRLSGVSPKVYTNTKAMLQKLLGVRARVSARDLCLQCGCVRLERLVNEMLESFKQRYLAQLPESQRGTVTLSKTVFVVAVFVAVARKHKFKVDKKRLVEPLGILPSELASASSAVDALLPELSTQKKKTTAHSKRKAEDGEPENIDGAAAVAAAVRLEGQECTTSDEEVLDEEFGVRRNPKKQARREYEAWKESVVQEKATQQENQPINTTLRQTQLSFGQAKKVHA